MKTSTGSTDKHLNRQEQNITHLYSLSDVLGFTYIMLAFILPHIVVVVIAAAVVVIVRINYTNL